MDLKKIQIVEEYYDTLHLNIIVVMYQYTYIFFYRRDGPGSHVIVDDVCSLQVNATFLFYIFKY